MFIPKSAIQDEYSVCLQLRKREPHLYRRALLTDYHRGTGIINWCKFLLEWTGAKINRRKREPRHIGNDQALARIDQRQSVSRIDSPPAAKIIQKSVVPNKC